ncbi:MAG: hypothetical protein HYX93_06455, partial [Chloroflexi bacterium]|nr:hypothetical protein [Chloroflexota bacterium]
MDVRKALKIKPILMVLAVAITAVALACAGDKAEPTEPAVAAPTATSPADDGTVSGAEATATPVPEADAAPDFSNLGWGAQEALSNPMYQDNKALWGEPQYGGVLKYRHPWASSSFNGASHWVFHSGHGPNLYWAALLDFETWYESGQGVAPIIPKLAKSWEIAEDGLAYTF